MYGVQYTNNKLKMLLFDFHFKIQKIQFDGFCCLNEM